jgi:hypothetical protein
MKKARSKNIVTLSLSGDQESIPGLLKSLQIRALDMHGKDMDDEKITKSER